MTTTDDRKPMLYLIASSKDFDNNQSVYGLAATKKLALESAHRFTNATDAQGSYVGNVVIEGWKGNELVWSHSVRPSTVLEHLPA